MRIGSACLIALIGVLSSGCRVSGICFSEGAGSCSSAAQCDDLYCSIGEASYDAVDALIAQCRVHRDLGRVLVGTFVDINNVERTSMFGRQFAEMAASRLTQRKVDVIHATVRQDHMRIDDRGQFLLSRRVQNLAGDYNAKCVLVGTYAVVNERVFVSLKLVSTVDDSTLAAADVEIEGTDTVMGMLSHGFSW